MTKHCYQETKILLSAEKRKHQITLYMNSLINIQVKLYEVIRGTHFVLKLNKFCQPNFIHTNYVLVCHFQTEITLTSQGFRTSEVLVPLLLWTKEGTEHSRNYLENRELLETLTNSIFDILNKMRSHCLMEFQQSRFTFMELI